MADAEADVASDVPFDLDEWGPPVEVSPNPLPRLVRRLYIGIADSPI